MRIPLHLRAMAAGRPGGLRCVRVAVAAIAIAAGVAGSIAGAQETAPETPPVGRSVWTGVYTEVQARRGEELYAAQCSECHGPLMEGDGPATPLSGAGFFANWDGRSLADMLDRTRTTMPMNRPGTLSRQQTVDILAFVLETNRFPAGEAELPRQAELLKPIKFLATKP